MTRKPTTPEGEMMFLLRIGQDITQQGLQELTGVHFTTFSRIESGGRTRPSRQVIAKFVEALGLSEETYKELLRLRQLPWPPPTPGEEQIQVSSVDKKPAEVIFSEPLSRSGR